MIRLTIPAIDEECLEAVREVLETGFLVQGKRVAAFESAIAEYVGCENAVAVNSGTSALHLSLLALGICDGDRVIVPAYSYPATANAVVLCGADPVFVDIEPDTFNMDPAALEATLEKLAAGADPVVQGLHPDDPQLDVQPPGQPAEAILPVHTFGQMADMERIGDLAARYDVPVIEDAACALGATWADQPAAGEPPAGDNQQASGTQQAVGGRQAGTWGIGGCFSFHPRKAITTGEGGMVVTGDAVLADLLRELRNHGQDPNATLPDFIAPGFNCRMTEFQAALGAVQLARMGDMIEARRQRAAVYEGLLEPTGVQPQATPPGSESVYQSFVVLLPVDDAAARDAVIAHLRKNEIEATIGTYHIPMTTYYRRQFAFEPGDFPVADEVFARSLTLPLHDKLTREEQEMVVRTLIEALEAR